MPDQKPVQGIQFKNQLRDNIGYKAFLELCRLSFVIFLYSLKIHQFQFILAKICSLSRISNGACLGYGFSGDATASHPSFWKFKRHNFFNKSNLGLLKDKVSWFRLSGQNFVLKPD